MQTSDSKFIPISKIDVNEVETLLVDERYVRDSINKTDESETGFKVGDIVTDHTEPYKIGKIIAMDLNGEPPIHVRFRGLFMQTNVFYTIDGRKNPDVPVTLKKVQNDTSKSPYNSPKPDVRPKVAPISKFTVGMMVKDKRMPLKVGRVRLNLSTDNAFPIVVEINNDQKWYTADGRSVPDGEIVLSEYKPFIVVD